MRRLAVAVYALSLYGCHFSHGPAAPAPTFVRDLHSHAQPESVRVTHVALRLGLDFAKHAVRGTVDLSLVRPDPDAPLILDAQGLAIEAVTGIDETPRKWELGPEDSRIGSALTIRLLPQETKVRVHYHTTPQSAALQWLSPEQTRDRHHPFLFTQGEAIFTRTWIPLQDSPGIRITYEAEVRAPRDLTVVMSAEQLGRGADSIWRFRMLQPIPPYLIALASGDLAFEPISARSGV